MNRQNFLKALISILILQLFYACSTPINQDKEAKKANRPNIILIISDDQSWTDYSFLGHKHIKTPRIDQLTKKINDWWEE